MILWYKMLEEQKGFCHDYINYLRTNAVDTRGSAALHLSIEQKHFNISSSLINTHTASILVMYPYTDHIDT